MMKMNSLLSAVLTISMAAAAAAAQTQGAGRGGHCKADAEALCKGQTGPQVISCLSANIAKVQDAACKTRIEKHIANDDALKKACSAEITADKCGGMDIGTGLLKCLGQNRKTLSDDCKAQLKSLRARGGRGRGRGQGGPAGKGSQDGKGSQEGSGDDAVGE